jgi:hypothetical protein
MIPVNVLAPNTLGWVATAVFCASYFFRRQATLRKVQAAGACLWILYGVAIGAVPVIVANVIVAGAALYSAFRSAGCESVGEGALNSGQPKPAEMKRVAEEI